MKYKVTIEEITPYEGKDTFYEGDDGKRYTSTYKIPEGVKYKTVSHPSGLMLSSTNTVFMQEKDGMDLVAVIRAINDLSDPNEY